MEISVQKVPTSQKNKILFPAYVCYFPATEIIFKKFLYRIRHSWDLGRRLRLWTKLQMEKYFTHTIQTQKYFLIALDYKIIYVVHSYRGDLVERMKRLVIQGDRTKTNNHTFVNQLSSILGIADYTRILCCQDHKISCCWPLAQ